MFILGLILFLIISTIVHHIMLAVEKKRYLPPGKLIEIDGHKMHIFGKGEGVPTVVMTCGSGSPSAYTEYSSIAREASKLTRTCIYERPGYGWSEHASTPRDTEQIVSDLRRLLEKAGEKPPYLFVAHSMGAMEVILYAQKYPSEVQGIVLIDGTSPYKHIHYPGASIPVIAIHALRILNWLGIFRIVGELGLIPLLTNRLRSMADNARAIDKAMVYKNMLNTMVIKEGELLADTARRMDKQQALGNIPLIIYAADRSLEKLPGWKKSQENLLKLSTQSEMIIVKESNHLSILLEHTDTIVNGIKGVIYAGRESDVMELGKSLKNTTKREVQG